MYQITLKIKDNAEMAIEADSHSIVEPFLFSIIGSDKRRYLVPISNIISIEFDARLDEIIQNSESNIKH